MTFQTKSKQHQIDRITLPNGITLLVVENQAADLIAGRFFFSHTGSIVESRAKAGISNLVSSVITKGTKNLSALEIAEAVESIGAGLGADSSTDYFGLSLKTVTADFAPMLKLLGEIIQYPSFPEAEVQLERKIALQTIRSQQEQPFNVAFAQLRKSIYGEHPYGVSVLGTEESVASLQKEDLKQFHQQYFRPDRLIISLSGRITTEKAVELVTQVFGNWRVPSTTPTLEDLPKIETKPSEEIILRDTQQSIVM